MWNSIHTAPQNVLVMTKIDDEKGVRNVQALTRQGNLFFGGSMYVYYTPTHWRYLTEQEMRKEHA